MCILANCGNLSVKGKLGVQYITKSGYLICGSEGGRCNRETVNSGERLQWRPGQRDVRGKMVARDVSGVALDIPLLVTRQR